MDFILFVHFLTISKKHIFLLDENTFIRVIIKLGNAYTEVRRICLEW